MKRIADTLAFLNLSIWIYAQFSYCVSSTLNDSDTTSMLTSTFGWHFYFLPISKSKSHIINHNQVGPFEATGNKTNSWPMRSP